jgi:Fe-S cluster assembly iron-binding protein IscA
MLSLTDNATTAIRLLMDENEMPDGCGLRLASAGDGSERVKLSAATSPDHDDSVVEAHGARVFIDHAVVPVLDNKVLDANLGNSGRVQFRLLEA